MKNQIRRYQLIEDPICNHHGILEILFVAIQSVDYDEPWDLKVIERSPILYRLLVDTRRRVDRKYRKIRLSNGGVASSSIDDCGQRLW
jgi:hypothetical protein